MDFTSMLPLLMLNQKGKTDQNGLMQLLTQSMPNGGGQGGIMNLLTQSLSNNGSSFTPPQNNNMLQLLMQTMSMQKPQNIKEKPRRLSPIENWCGNDVVRLMTLLIEHNG